MASIKSVMVIYSSNYFSQIEFTGADVPILSSGQN
jgi:hypothetical protein